MIRGDFAFLFDTSLSMEPCIGAMRLALAKVINDIQTAIEDSGRTPDLRFKVCGFRNGSPADTMIWHDNPFSSDVADLQQQLGALGVGTDSAVLRPLLDALVKLSSMPVSLEGEPAALGSWRHRRDSRCFIVVFTDASCHLVTLAPEAGGATFDDVAMAIMAARLRLFLYAPETDCYETVSAIDNCEWVYIKNANEIAALVADGRFTRKILNALCRVEAISDTPAPPDPASLLNSEAIVCQSRGDYDQAESKYRQALVIAEEKFGTDHPGICAILDNLASLLIRIGDYAGAEPLCRRSLGIRKLGGIPDGKEQRARQRLCDLYDKMGRPEDALRLLGKESCR